MERFQVEVRTFPADEVRFIAALRMIGKVTLADAVAIHRFACNAQHTVLVAGIDRDVAAHIVDTFAAAGTEVVVEPCAFSTPMVCRPEANVAYRRSALRGAVKASLDRDTHE